MPLVLLTGATGFVGTAVARELLKGDCRIVALVRSRDCNEAERRLRRNWHDFPELERSIGDKVEVLPGDISLKHLGLEIESYQDLVSRLTHIINTAADIRLNAPLEELRTTNTVGVENLLQLAKEVQKDRGLSRFSHVSTAYVAGGRKGAVPENEITHSFGFLSNYERSKYEGEVLVQKAKVELPISIFRPGMIVGDSRTGWIKTFNTLYYPLRLYMTGRARVVPVKGSQLVNLVPVDFVARSIVTSTFDEKAVGLTFHLTPLEESQPTVRELILFVRGWARDNLNINLPRPIFLPLPTSLLTMGKDGEKESLKVIDDYLNEDREFLTENVEKLLGPYPLKWNDFFPALLHFATYHSFLHRSERTVHEQILFRLDSRRRPVRIHDIVDGKVLDREAPDVKKEMLASAASLKKLGIKRGDRVAIIGLNSSRYLSLDVACGLIGAVTVPLYFTMPPAEVKELVSESGAKILFIGVPSLLERMEEIGAQVPVISFARSNTDGVMTWQEFLERGEGEKISSSAPVDFRDLATIRYTSSTTGKAKGVMFHHHHLLWMAETIASLPSWKARTSPISYIPSFLSFLPLNHVVEGILGTYSPYYAAAPIDIFFLEDFKNLPQGLVASRPTVFFSVPRFFEKAWSGLQEGGAGKRYVRMKKGVMKSILRPLVRRAFLERSGLNRCDMLISGSAPIGDDLLLDYRELGIEVYDAYGETEAPLVTINRPGRIRIGTVGEPLPETEVRIAEDEEILVKGPQVTSGYYGTVDQQPFQDGWLLTGDYGRLTEEGSLVILGRKKELIKTSYGKFVHPMKIESLVRDIPGVLEAMLVGEGRPFCSALIWVENGHQDGASLDAIEKEIERINSQLSNPKRVRRWALITDELSIERGDLTPNLKLKRRNIGLRYSDVISLLYGEKKRETSTYRIGGLE